MRKFNIGDIIIGNEYNSYAFTNRINECEVVCYYNDVDTPHGLRTNDIGVRVYKDGFDDEIFPVQSWKFKFVRTAKSMSIADWNNLMFEEV